MPYKEKDTVRLYYSIGEVAEMFGVNISMIRYYEKEFDIIKPHKNKKGNRLFTRADIENFTRIFHMIRDQGHTLANVRELISKGEATFRESANDEVRRRLKSVRNLLRELSAKIDADQ